MCGICDIQNKQEPIDLFTEEEIDNIILAIYAGVISVRNLPYEVYKRVAQKLMSGVYDGYGRTFESVIYGSEDYFMLRALRENIYIFSGAKTYQQVRQMSSLLVGKDNVTMFSDFKKQAKAIFTEYNDNYLRTEYNSAIAQARTASQWHEITKNAKYNPMLTYQTAGDGRVRPTHAELNNITRPVTDKFWDSYMPPNGWNCRCTVVQSDDEKETDLSGFKQPNDVPDIFMFNAGKERIVFSKKHPYFKVAKRDKEWAKNNFGFPIG